MWRRLRETIFRGRWEEDLTDEIRFHLEALEGNFRARGMTAEEARLAARREFGAVDAMKEQYRDRRGLPWLETLWRDLRFGARLLRRSPGFTFVAVLTLALGLGANTAIFTLVHAVLLRTAPVEDAEHLVTLQKSGPVYLRNFPYRFFRELSTRGDLLRAIAATAGTDRGRIRASAASDTEQAWHEAVSGTYFQTLGVRPELGRLLGTSDETVAGGDQVAVISYDCWQSRLAADPGVLGRRILVNDRPFTVIGVAAAGFRGLDPMRPVEVWVPLTMVTQSAWLRHETASWLTLVGRPAPGVSPEQLRAAVDVSWRNYIRFALRGQAHPWKDDLLAQHIRVSPAASGVPGWRDQFEKPLAVLMGIVVLVLAIACANVGNLLIARGAARAREMNLRLSIGATRGRLVRQLFTESLLLAAAGGAAGLVLSVVTGRLLARILPFAEGTLPLDLNPDGRVLAFTSAASIAAALTFGILPAWRVLQARPANDRLRRVLVVVQVCLSLVVLAGAGLFVRTLSGLRSVDTGFRPQQVLTFWLDLPSSYSPVQAASVFTRALDALAAVPGVSSVSCASPGPFRAGKASRTLRVHGDPAEEPKPVDLQTVTPGYFATLQTRLLAGRYLSEQDRTGTPGAVVVNEAFVRRHLDGAPHVLGSRVGFGRDRDGGPFVPIVGVVTDIRHQGLRDAPVPSVYVPMRREEAAAGASIQVRGAASLEDLRRAVRQVDRAALLNGARSLQDQLDDSLSRERLLAALGSYFALLALVLSAVGLYGVVAYSVVRRTREIGIRVAIGAARGEILWMFVRESLMLAAWGALGGLPAAFFASRLAAGLLFGVRPGDPQVLAFAALVLFATGACAAFIPARRAASLPPSQALRCE